MRQLFVFKDTNYGASKTSATVNTATTPDQLADGAIGIYGIDPVLNAGNLSLITDAAVSSGSLVNKSDFKGDTIHIYQGTEDGCRISTVIPLADHNLKSITSQAFKAAIKGIFYVGYNGASGSLNLPAVINRGDEGILVVNDKSKTTSALTVGRSYSGYANSDGVTGYEILTDLLSKIYNVDNGQDNREIDAEIVSDLIGSGAVFATSATADVVFGSTAVATSAAHGVDEGDYIAFNGNMYQAIAVPTTTSITLDRPYRGVTETVANGDTEDLGAAFSGEVGLKLTDREGNVNLKYSLSSLFESSSITQAVTPERSTGTGAQVLDLERIYKPHRGQLDNIHSWMPQPESYALAGTNYDLYNVNAGSNLSNSDHMGYGKVGDTELLLAFKQDVADTAGKNQSDFEDIMTVFYPDFVTLF